MRIRDWSSDVCSSDLTAGQVIPFIKAQVPANAIMVNMTLFTVSSVVILTAGTMFVMWLGEKITDKGIGNGISLIIMIGIIAWLPQALIQEGAAQLGSGSAGGEIALIVEKIGRASGRERVCQT